MLVLDTNIPHTIIRSDATPNQKLQSKSKRMVYTDT